jgi:hypothetical protein
LRLTSNTISPFQGYETAVGPDTQGVALGYHIAALQAAERLAAKTKRNGHQTMARN